MVSRNDGENITEYDIIDESSVKCIHVYQNV